MARLVRAATDRNPPTSGGGGCQVTVPIGECPDPYCRVRGCKTCGRVTPQAWEEVLNNAQEGNQ